MKYAVAISGFQSELIIKPFLVMLEPLDEFVLFTTQNPKSTETAREVSTFLSFANVRCTTVPINDIFNFFELLASLENLSETKGKPLWLNVSAGPGIAISALTYFAIIHEMAVVFFNKENNKTSRVEIAKSKDLFRNARKNLRLLRLLENTSLTLDDLTSKINLSKSTVSRRVSVLKSAYLVNTNMVNKKMLVSISETGHILLGTKNVSKNEK
jgi:DNA-binding transcriptional ArsR family regulator